MNFRDRWEKDKNGEDFIFTVEMQRSLSQAGLPIDPANLAKLNINPQKNQTNQNIAQAEEKQSSTTDQKQDVTNDFNIQIDPQTGKYIGRMKWFNPKKGYGFLVRGAGEEIFFHKSNTIGRAEDLAEGQWVLYDVEETHKGPEATEIEPYENASD